MKVIASLFVGFLVLISCNNSPNETPVTNQSPEEPIAEEEFIMNTLNNKTIPNGLLLLRGVEADEDLEHAIQDNLYGRFFADRAEFFVIEKPLNKIHGTSIESITMFYLDGQLSQTKYIMDNDISESLIRQFGSFTIIGLDNENKTLIKKREVLLEGTGDRLNPELSNYEITWTLGSRQVRYRVNKEDEREMYKYVERMSNYERIYKNIELVVN